MRRPATEDVRAEGEAQGRRDAVSIARGRRMPVRATRMPEDGRRAAFARAMADILNLTPGGLFEEE